MGVQTYFAHLQHLTVDGRPLRRLRVATRPQWGAARALLGAPAVLYLLPRGRRRTPATPRLFCDAGGQTLGDGIAELLHPLLELVLQLDGDFLRNVINKCSDGMKEDIECNLPIDILHVRRIYTYYEVSQGVG